MSREFRKQVEEIKKKKIREESVVSLAEFRELKSEPAERIILVVDDDDVMRAAINRILESEGYKVILAKDGMELSRIVDNSVADLVLLDINLPWVDGFELCKLLKGHRVWKTVPVIMISSRSSKEDVHHGLDLGADDFVAKPFDVDHIVGVISRKLGDIG